ncbi:MAG: nucleotidyltransferase family protein [Elainellaceae cyanobacterium]
MQNAIAMTETEIIIQTLQKHLPELRSTHNVKTLGLFGSYSRGEQTSESDVDILIEFGKAPSLLKFIDLENQLSELLGEKVDLVMKTALKPRIGDRILKEVVYL